MPLFDPARTPDVSPEDAVAIAHAFLQQCRSWVADVELPKRRQAILDDNAPEHAAKLHQWLSYLEFTDHAINELEDGTLDHWFTGP